MIDPAVFLAAVIDPACAVLSDVVMHRDMGTAEARVLLLAIALQESGLEHRRQIGADGKPMDTLARGFFQFEAGGGVAGVMSHSASCGPAEDVCALLRVPFATSDVHEAMAWNDLLAAVYARLLLWTDAAPLPAIGNGGAAWETYLRVWRPGKPHQETWGQNYMTAVQTVLGMVPA